jgi:hypothetical protein
VTVADLRAGDYTISWGIPREIVERAIEHSLPFGVYRGVEQLGFARVITDRALGFAPLNDASRIMEGLRTSPYLSA